MDKMEEEILTDLQYVELKKQINAIWRVLEGDVKVASDWLLNARLIAHSATKPSVYNIPQAGGNLITKSFETDGGMVYGIVMTMGEASNAQVTMEVRLNGEAILPAYKPSLNGAFSEVMIFNQKVEKGKHTLNLYTKCTSGSAHTFAQGAKMFFFLPGKKFI